MGQLTNLVMWLTNDILSLSYATVNFAEKTILWNAGQHTPKRANALAAALERGSDIRPTELENVA